MNKTCTWKHRRSCASTQSGWLVLIYYVHESCMARTRLWSLLIAPLKYITGSSRMCVRSWKGDWNSYVFTLTPSNSFSLTVWRRKPKPLDRKLTNFIQTLLSQLLSCLHTDIKQELMFLQSCHLKSVNETQKQQLEKTIKKNKEMSVSYLRSCGIESVASKDVFTCSKADFHKQGRTVTFTFNFQVKRQKTTIMHGSHLRLFSKSVCHSTMSLLVLFDPWHHLPGSVLNPCFQQKKIKEKKKLLN